MIFSAYPLSEVVAGRNVYLVMVFKAPRLKRTPVPCEGDSPAGPALLRIGIDHGGRACVALLLSLGISYCHQIIWYLN